MEINPKKSFKLLSYMKYITYAWGIVSNKEGKCYRLSRRMDILFILYRLLRET